MRSGGGICFSESSTRTESGGEQPASLMESTVKGAGIVSERFHPTGRVKAAGGIESE